MPGVTMCLCEIGPNSAWKTDLWQRPRCCCVAGARRSRWRPCVFLSEKCDCSCWKHASGPKSFRSHRVTPGASSESLLLWCSAKCWSNSIDAAFMWRGNWSAGTSAVLWLGAGARVIIILMSLLSCVCGFYMTLCPLVLPKEQTLTHSRSLENEVPDLILHLDVGFVLSC